MTGSPRRAAHLARRLVASLAAREPGAADAAWVAALLTPTEHALWASQPRADRCESIAVARRLERRLAGTPHAREPAWPAAALLHDVGKRDARLGTAGRVAATLAGAAGGPGLAARWAGRSGRRGRVAAYLAHAEAGAALIRAAGGRAEAAAGVAAHHRPDRWPGLGFPAGVAEALAAADGERA